MLSVDANLRQPEARRVTFYTGNNNIFYLELAIDGPSSSSSTISSPSPPPARRADGPGPPAPAPAAAAPAAASDSDTDDLPKSLGMWDSGDSTCRMPAGTRV